MSKSVVIDLPDKFNSRNANLLKYASLITLTLQNAAVNLTLRYSRTRKQLFIASTAVFLGELIKLISCLFMVRVEEGSIVRAYRAMHTHIVSKPIETAMVALPSLVYYIQNNLIYIGATHLDAATCQITYQLKIFTTAVFSLFLLKKRIHPHQWVALVLLFVGVATVQVEQLSKSTTKSGEDGKERASSPLIGFTAIILACCSSGFAGVYFEKVLKGNSEISLWIRNVQLSTISVPIGCMQLLLLDHQELGSKGFFYGYSMITWVVIILQAQGGLLTAVVVKYADNILKGFATSLAIIISCIISVYLFHFQLSFSFLFGASLVISATFLYSKPIVPKHSHHNNEEKL